MVERAPGKPSPLQVMCTDWHMAIEGTTLRLTPSGRTVARQLVYPCLALMFMVCLILMFGLPPGANRVAAQRKQVANLERAVAQSEQRLSRIAGSTTGRDSIVFQGAERQVAGLREQLASSRARLEQMQPTLGSTGDMMYWSAMGVLLVAGLFMPAVALITCCRISYEGPPGRGVIRVVERGVYTRVTEFPAETFLAMGVHVQRMVAPRSRGRLQVDDLGWMWMIVLLTDPADAGSRDLYVSVEQEPTLPTQVGRLTSRVRDAVRFLEALTVLEAQEPLVTDVVSLKPGWLGTRILLRSSREPERARRQGDGEAPSAE